MVFKVTQFCITAASLKWMWRPAFFPPYFGNGGSHPLKGLHPKSTINIFHSIQNGWLQRPKTVFFHPLNKIRLSCASVGVYSTNGRRQQDISRKKIKARPFLSEPFFVELVENLLNIPAAINNSGSLIIKTNIFYPQLSRDCKKSNQSLYSDRMFWRRGFGESHEGRGWEFFNCNI